MIIVMFAISMTILEILDHEWVKVKCKYANGKAVCDFLFVGSNYVCPICHLSKDIQLKSARLWPWSLEWAKAKCKYAIRNATSNFPCVGNSNVCPIRHCLADNHIWTLPMCSIRIFLPRKWMSRTLTIEMQIGTWTKASHQLTLKMWAKVTFHKE